MEHRQQHEQIERRHRRVEQRNAHLRNHHPLQHHQQPGDEQLVRAQPVWLPGRYRCQRPHQNGKQRLHDGVHHRPAHAAQYRRLAAHEVEQLCLQVGPVLGHQPCCRLGQRLPQHLQRILDAHQKHAQIIRRGQMDGPVRQEHEGRDHQDAHGHPAQHRWPAVRVIPQRQRHRPVRLHDPVGQQTAPGIDQQRQQHRNHQPLQDDDKGSQRRGQQAKHGQKSGQGSRHRAAVSR